MWSNKNKTYPKMDWLIERERARERAYRIEIMDCGFLTYKIVNENKNRIISYFLLLLRFFIGPMIVFFFKFWKSNAWCERDKFGIASKKPKKKLKNKKREREKLQPNTKYWKRFFRANLLIKVLCAVFSVPCSFLTHSACVFFWYSYTIKCIVCMFICVHVCVCNIQFFLLSRFFVIFHLWSPSLSFAFYIFILLLIFVVAIPAVAAARLVVCGEYWTKWNWAQTHNARKRDGTAGSQRTREWEKRTPHLIYIIWSIIAFVCNNSV